MERESSANKSRVAVHPLTIPRRLEIDGSSFVGIKHGADLMAMYGADGRLLFVFDSVDEVDIRVPDAPDDQPVTDADLHRARVESFDARGDEGIVYFVGGDVGAIKIGRTTNLAARLRAFQASSPIPLRVLATREGASRERLYHRLFAAHRMHGEWFDRHPDILAEIERLQAEVPA